MFGNIHEQEAMESSVFPNNLRCMLIFVKWHTPKKLGLWVYGLLWIWCGLVHHKTFEMVITEWNLVFDFSNFYLVKLVSQP